MSMDDHPVEVHGGLTYSNWGNEKFESPKLLSRKSMIWWFGFDCAHFWRPRTRRRGESVRSRNVPRLGVREARGQRVGGSAEEEREGGKLKRIKKLLDALALCALFSTVATGQGQVGEVPHKRVVGGESVIGGELPFVAKIIYGNNRVGCTGSLIAPDKVLTAGHCVDSYRKEDISVAFGNQRTRHVQLRRAFRIHMHPDIDTENYFYNDVAVIELQSDVRSIKPVRILRREEEQLDVRGVGLIAGWGYTSAGEGTLPDTMHKAFVPIYSPKECQRIRDDLYHEGKIAGWPKIHPEILCAGEEGRAISGGDSGGPLLVRTPEGWRLIGVASQRVRDPSGDIVYLGTYTRTSTPSVYSFIYPRPDAYRLYFAHFATGDGWDTDLLLLNTSETDVEATVRIIGRGHPEEYPLKDLSVPAMRIKEWTLPHVTLPRSRGLGERPDRGGIVVTSDEKLAGFMRFRHISGARTSVSSTELGNAFMIPVSAKAERTGLAIFNPNEFEHVTVILSSGSCKVYQSLFPHASIAKFILPADLSFPGRDTFCGDEDYRNITNTFTVRTQDEREDVTVLALEMTDGKLVTLPAVALED